MILAEITADNKIQISESENPVADGVLFETIKFIFPPSWNGYLKTAVFKTQEKTVNVLLTSENELCLSDSECYIPHEVLTGEQFELTVFGVKDDSIATAEKQKIDILDSGYALGENPSEPTPSEYQQLINLTKSAVDIAQSVRDDADAGLFNGESGNDIIIDQTYDPESENAQSGVAMSGVLKKYLSVDSNAEWVFDGGNAESSMDIELIVDSEISDTSNNAISNRAVKEYIDKNIDNVENYVTEVEKKIEADYIIEQGTEGIWTYRKWASGMAECWGRNTSIQTTPWSDLQVMLDESLPFTFTEVPVINCSGHQYGTASSYIMHVSASTTIVSAYMQCADPPNDVYVCWFNFRVIGRWK